MLPGHDCTMSRSVRSTRIKNMGGMIVQEAKQTTVKWSFARPEYVFFFCHIVEGK